MYVKQVELQEIFDIGHTYCTNICRLIDSRHDRYGEIPNIGSRYNVVCFADCMANYKALKQGLPVKPFDYDKVADELPKEITTPRSEELIAQYEAGAAAMKQRIFDDVWDWFNSVYVSDEVKDLDALMRSINFGVMSAITGSKL